MGEIRAMAGMSARLIATASHHHEDLEIDSEKMGKWGFATSRNW